MNISDLARVARSLLVAKSYDADPVTTAEELYGRTARHVPELLVTKASVASADTSGALFSPRTVSTEFAEAVRPQTVLGRLNAIRVPLATPLGFLATRTVFDFVEEKSAIPVAAASLGSLMLGPRKVAGVIVLTKELARHSRAEEVLQREMVSGCAEGIDLALLDPSRDETDGRPAAVTHGAQAFDANGLATPGELDDLFSTLAGHVADLGSTLVNAAWVMGPANAVALATLRDGDGSQAFPTVTVTGGTLCGLPLLVSASMPADGLALIDGAEIMLGDEDETQISVTDSAMLDQDDAPSGATRVSVFQADALALKVVRIVNWKMRHPFCAYAADFSLPAGGASTA